MRSVSQHLGSQESSELEKMATASSNSKPDVSNQMVQEQQNEEKAEAFETAAKDLGSIGGMHEATSAVGTLIDTLVPRDGNSASLSINFNIPVHPLVKITIGLSGWAGRFGGNVILNSSVNVGARLEGSVKALWVELEAYLAVKGLGYIKTMGDSGSEAFDLMGLGIHEIIAQHSEKIASFMMSDSERKAIIANMTDSEYAELGLGVSVSAGASAKAGGVSNLSAASEVGSEDGDDEGVMQGVSASAGYTKGVKFTDEDHDGTLEKQSVAKASGSFGLNLNLGKFGLSDLSGSTGISVDVFYTNDEVSKIIANLEFSATTQPTSFGWSFLAECCSEISMEIAKIISNGADHFSGSAGEKIGKIADTVGGLSIADNVASRLGNQFSEQIPGSPAFKSKTAFRVGIFWQSGGSGNVNFRMSSSKSSGVDIGVASINASMDEVMFSHKIPFQTS